MKSDSGTEYFDSNIINYRTSGRWKRLQNAVQIALLLLKRLILGEGGVLAVTQEMKNMKTIHPFSMSMSTIFKEASYFLSGFHSDKECQNENSPLTLHRRTLCNFFLLP